ncbi:MAG: alpha/beta hydrolase [Gammaproteobacteria bacterium]
MPVKSTRLAFEGPSGNIEAMLDSPDGIEPDSSSDLDAVPAVAVVCHPHPQFQGTMLNKVVHTLSRSAVDCGIPALRFNYRGVGKSAGVYDEGRGETDDAEAACDYAFSLFGERPLVLMGFSFGAGVALRLAQRRTSVALIAAAPPVGRLGVPDTVTFDMPWQIIQGNADELVDAADVQTWAGAQEPPPEFVMMEGVSHFFHGNLTSLRHDARLFLTRSLSLPSD